MQLTALQVHHEHHRRPLVAARVGWSGDWTLVVTCNMPTYTGGKVDATVCHSSDMPMSYTQQSNAVCLCTKNS